MTIFDPESLAIEILLKLDDLLGKSIGHKEQMRESKCPALYRRAVELPQLLAQAGLVETMLFYLSKSDQELYNTLMEVLKGGAPEATGKLSKMGEECGKEGRGYTIGLAIITYAINRMAEHKLLETASNECTNINRLQELAKCLKAIRDRGVEIRVERLLEPYLHAVKRLAEAFYKEREGE